MARRYGVLPSDLAHLSAEDFAFNRLVFFSGLEDEAKQAAKQKKLSSANLRGMVSR